MSNFLELVAKERSRQINDEGYKREHDDEHTDGSIADAAACYAANGTIYKATLPKNMQKSFKYVWPWNWSFFKKEKHTRKKQLIISAALLMAEYERIERAEQKTKKDFMGSIDEMYD
jgi:hypothetical protein